MNPMRARLGVIVVVAWCALTAWGAGVRTDELGNGLTVVISPGVISPGVVSPGVVSPGEDAPGACHLVIRRGSMHEREGERGAALVAARALMIHLSREDPGALALFGVDAEGAARGEGVLVSEGYTAFRMRAGEGEEIGRALGVVRTALDAFAPGEGVIDAALSSVLEEARRRRESSALMHARASALADLLGGGPMSQVPLALERDLSALTPDRVRGFIDACWRAPASTLMLVGVDPGIGEIEGALGAVARRDASGSSIGGRIIGDVSGNLSLTESDRFETDLVGLVWFDERDSGAPVRTSGEMAALALAGEVMRARVNRVVRGTTRGVRSAGVLAGEMHGRVLFAQIIVRTDPGAWRGALGAIARERTRLVRDGVSAQEVDRARAIIEPRWERKHDGWSGGGVEARAAVLEGLVASGRVGVDPGSWLGGVRARIGSMHADEVNRAVARLIGGSSPASIVMVSGGGGIGRGMVRRVLASALSADPGPLDERWRGPIAETVLDRAPVGGSIEEVRAHTASGVTSARLGNGVWVHHREMRSGEPEGRVHVRVHVGLRELEPANLSGAVRVVHEAMARGRLGARLDDEVSLYLADHAIEAETRFTAMGLTIGVHAPARSFAPALEYVYGLLTDLRIDDALVGAVAPGGTPIGAMDRALLRARGVALGARDWDGLGDALDAASVSRWWSGALRGARIEVGVCGPIDAETALGGCASVLGGLRDQGDRASADLGVGAGESGDRVLGASRVVRLRDGSGRTGVGVGFGACGRGEVDEVRALVVASMVLRERIGGGAVAGVVIPELSDRAFVVVRIDCDASRIGALGAEIESSMVRAAEEGFGKDEVERAKASIGAILGGGARSCAFWSDRLARLGETGQRVEDVWSIESAYASMDASRVGEVFSRWHARGVHVRVEFVGEDD